MEQIGCVEVGTNLKKPDFDDEIESEDPCFNTLPADVRLWTVEELDALLQANRLPLLEKHFALLQGLTNPCQDVGQALLLLDVWISSEPGVLSRSYGNQLPDVLKLLLVKVIQEYSGLKMTSKLFQFMPVSLLSRLLLETLRGTDMESHQ